METLIEELLAAIQTDSRYLTFMALEKEILAIPLLQEYREAMQQYQEVKKYAKYIDITKQKEKMMRCKRMVSAHPVVQEYYQAYKEINEVLESVTKIVFDGISPDLRTERFTI